MVLGVLMIVGAAFAETENTFISSFGLALAVMGFAQCRRYFLITRSEETIREREIAETDERNMFIMYKAKNAALSIYLILCGAVVIVLSFLSMHEIASWIAYSVCLLVLLYWICYFIYRKKI
jgi:uncharacterized membrane protein